MKFGVITDCRFMDDYQNRDEQAAPSWDTPPRYLLGRLVSSPYFLHEVKFVPYEISNPDECRARFKECDYGIIHIDMTVLPDKILQVKRQVPPSFVLINRHVSDIRKSTLNNLLSTHNQMTLDLQANIEDDTEMFIKSNFNAGDAPKRLYKKCRYADLPPSVRKDSSLIVQRFVLEKLTSQHSYFRLRRFIIVGQEIVQVEYFSKHFVIKRSSSVWQYSRDIQHIDADLGESNTPNISELGYQFNDFHKNLGDRYISMLNFLQAIGLQFCTVDVITPSSDEFYILDINYTPWERGLPDSLVKILSRSLVNMVKSL